jgi:hypothetical protein
MVHYPLPFYRLTAREWPEAIDSVPAVTAVPLFSHPIVILLQTLQFIFDRVYGKKTRTQTPRG